MQFLQKYRMAATGLVLPQNCWPKNQSCSFLWTTGGVQNMGTVKSKMSKFELFWFFWHFGFCWIDSPELWALSHGGKAPWYFFKKLVSPWIHLAILMVHLVKNLAPYDDSVTSQRPQNPLRWNSQPPPLPWTPPYYPCWIWLSYLSSTNYCFVPVLLFWNPCVWNAVQYRCDRHRVQADADLHLQPQSQPKAIYSLLSIYIWICSVCWMVNTGNGLVYILILEFLRFWSWSQSWLYFIFVLVFVLVRAK